MAINTLEGSVKTNVDHVHCFSCKAVVSIHEVLDAWSDPSTHDRCPRCADFLFCTKVIKMPR